MNGCPIATFELDGFNGDSDYAVSLFYPSACIWLDFAAQLPAEGLPCADIAKQVMAMQHRQCFT